MIEANLKENLKKFFEENPLAVRAGESIKDGRQIGVIVTSGEEQTVFTFSKRSGRNSFTEEAASSPDLVFTIPEASARSLIEGKFDSVGQIGLHFFEKMLAKDPAVKITVKLHSGFLSLMTSGYLGVLTAGGSEIAKFLADLGLGNIGKLKETISRLKS